MSMNSFNQDFLCPASHMVWGRLFGSCIEKTRIACDRSVEEAAHLAGMETSEWLDIEAGSVPDAALLHPMSDALGLRFEKIALLAFICQGAWKQ